MVSVKWCPMMEMHSGGKVLKAVRSAGLMLREWCKGERGIDYSVAQRRVGF